ncbi:MAG: diguanylate cyclase [Candidatus Cloacimonetes bacterium]|nr:diguanylate cyclase [Candidatus Cloacimonadota bacterium]
MDCLPQEGLYAQILNSSVVAIGLTDLQGRYCVVNPAWSELLGYSEAEASELCISDVTPEENRSESENNYNRLITGQVTQIRIRREYLCKDGSRIWADLHVSPLRNTENEIIGILGIFISIDTLVSAENELQRINQELSQSNQELIELNHKLNRMARRDQLTGLYNRRVLDENLEYEMERSRRNKRGFTLAMADLDDFKKVNDTYGHPCGDEVLKAVAKTMKEALRTVDTVGRWGGEEFLVILPETSAEDAAKVLNRIREKIKDLVVNCEENQISISISIGMSSCDRDCPKDEIIKEADLALYEAKKRGKNRVICYQNI